MEEHPQFAKGICNKVHAAKKWEEFTTELICLGPPIRTAAKWIKVWADMKSKAKKKMSQNKAELRATGGGPNKLQGLSSTEESIIGLLQFDVCINPPGVEFGLDTTTSDQFTVLSASNPSPELLVQNYEESEVDLNLNVHEEPAEKTRTNKKSQKAERLRLLELQTDGQKQFYEQMISTLHKIKQSAAETAEYSKKNYELKKNATDELLQLKREKLRVYKEEVLKKQQDRRSKLQLKVAILEIKKKLLSK
ncbi:uncharacterized protein LOC128869723 [Anastrepha ludens]|uniref:uncharacterized protein LOC128869723 n=1 Tax=Anastrepha ludens TaxID=28586 RepID=UPI0023AFB358|nr:uncharacterized protein LOC128869723 [Anastrepha ludens]